MSTWYNKGNALKYVLAMLIAGAACWMLASLGQCGGDTWHVFRPAAKAYLRGETRLFDGNAPHFFLAPWGIFGLLPLAWLPAPWMWAIIMVANLAGIMLACYAVTTRRMPKLAPLLTLICTPVLSLTITGNVDGIMAGAVGLGWLAIERRRPWLLGLALLVLSCKPVNVALVALLFLRLAWRWPSKGRLAVVAPTGAVLALSFPVFGLDWPARYLQALINTPPWIEPQVGLWRTFAWVGWPVWPAYVLAGIAALAAVGVILETKRPDAGTLALVLTLSLAFSPYVLNTHFVLLAPVLIWLAALNHRWLWLWTLTLMPIAQWWLGNEAAWLALAYPIALLQVVCLQTRLRANHGQR